MLPHRAHRRLTTATRTSPVFILLFLAFFEVALLVALPALFRAGVLFDAKILEGMGQAAPILNDDFLHLGGLVIGVGLPPIDYRTLAELVVAGVALIAAVSFVRPLVLPIRYAINLHLILLTAAAAYLLIGGPPGYDGAEFSALILHTALLTVPAIAVFVCAMGLLFPLSIQETISFAVIAVAYDLLLSLLRYALFLVVAAHFGAIVLPTLFMLYGPLIDVLPLSTILMVLLSRVSARLQRTPGAWQWM
jgi:hypothetical protein